MLGEELFALLNLGSNELLVVGEDVFLDGRLHEFFVFWRDHIFQNGSYVAVYTRLKRYITRVQLYSGTFDKATK